MYVCLRGCVCGCVILIYTHAHIQVPPISRLTHTYYFAPHTHIYRAYTGAAYFAPLKELLDKDADTMLTYSIETMGCQVCYLLDKVGCVSSKSNRPDSPWSAG